jgi:hypothetical protein
MISYIITYDEIMQLMSKLNRILPGNAHIDLFALTPTHTSTILFGTLSYFQQWNDYKLLELLIYEMNCPLKLLLE